MNGKRAERNFMISALKPSTMILWNFRKDAVEVWMYERRFNIVRNGE
jgi:hypothetical protein